MVEIDIKKSAIALIIAFVIALIAFSLLPDVMNQAELAKFNTNVTDSQGVIVDIVGLIVMIGVAVGVFNLPFIIKQFKT